MLFSGMTTCMEQLLRNHRVNKMSGGGEELAIVRWCNWYLRAKGYSIKDILDLEDGVFLIVLLELLTGQQAFQFNGGSRSGDLGDENQNGGDGGEKSRDRNWTTIMNFLGISEKSSLLISAEKYSNEEIRRSTLVDLLWHVILHYHTFKSNKSPPNMTGGRAHTGKRPCFNREVNPLLSWVNSKLPKGIKRVDNWTTDWMDGTMLCHLINSIRPGCIPPYKGTDTDDGLQEVREIRIRAACSGAEKELGIPDLILPEELSGGHCKEEVLTTYVAFLREIDLQRTKKTPNNVSGSPDSKKSAAGKTISGGIAVQPTRCLAFGSGLRWGQVGKPAEFVLQLQPGMSVSDLLVSIECRPYDEDVSHFRPELQIKPFGRACYRVRYTPTRPGEYIINIFCGEEYLPNISHHVRIVETKVPGEKLLDEDQIVIEREDEFFSSSLLSSDSDKNFLPPSMRHTKSLEEISNSYNSRHDASIASSLESDKNFLPTPPPMRFAKSIEETMSTSYNSRHDSAFVDDDSIRSLSVSSGDVLTTDWLDTDLHDGDTNTFVDYRKTRTATNKITSNFKIFGAGLHSGEVGRISLFTVHTPTYQSDENGDSRQGPLAVSITCPAMSIPVPFVKTKFSPGLLEHRVLYVPTEPGIYEISVKWGDDLVCGSPFRLTVSDSAVHTYPGLFLRREQEQAEGKNRIPKFRDADKFDFYLYYAATSADPSQHQRKDVLTRILRKNRPAQSVFCIPIDVEFTSGERRKLYEQAGGCKKLPLVFVDNEYVGSYNELMDKHHGGRFRQFIEMILRDLKSNIQRMNSWSSDELI